MTAPDDSLSPDTLSGLDEVRTHVADLILHEAAAHPHLDETAIHIITMYIVGSLGAGDGRKGSDLDLIVALRYDGDVIGDAQYDWLEYVQSDIEPVLKQNRSTLAQSLPTYIGYVDPKLGDLVDCRQFVREMSQHGDYDRVYDLSDHTFMQVDRI